MALAEAHSRKWQRALQYEQEQRIHLEETIEQLAKQHNSLERAFRNSLPGRSSDPSKNFNSGERWAGPGHSSRSLLPAPRTHASPHLASLPASRFHFSKDKFSDPTVPSVPGLAGGCPRLGVMVPWEGQLGHPQTEQHVEGWGAGALEGRRLVTGKHIRRADEGRHGRFIRTRPPELGGRGAGGHRIRVWGAGPVGSGPLRWVRRGSVKLQMTQQLCVSLESLLTSKEEDSEEDEDTEYFDAMEDSTAFITVITEAKEDRWALRAAALSLVPDGISA